MSCTHLVFCMRTAKSVPWPGATSLTVSLLDVPEHSGCEANLPQKIQFFWGRIGVTNHC